MLSEKREQALLNYEKYMRESNSDNCLEYEEKYRATDNELLRIIEEKYHFTVGTFHLLDRKQKNEILHELKSQEDISICQLVRVTGTIKYVVEKV